MIIVGGVAAIEESAREKESDPDRPGPSVATIKVLQILKGRYEAASVRVRSGPISSCAPWSVHVKFEVGEKRVYLFPEQPIRGETGLAWGGSLLELSRVPSVEARVLRAKAYREEYLDRIKMQSPKTFDNGASLAKEMRKAVATWPESAEKGFKSSVQDLATRLKAEETESARLAVALDWLDSDANGWYRHEVWMSAVRQSRETRGAEFAAAERDRLKAELTRASVEAPLIVSYLNAIKKGGLQGAMDFPPSPYALATDASAVDLTTDFMVRYRAYDRGRMFSYYGMQFELLEKIDPARVALILPAMFGSDDEQLSLVAFRAIERMPGVHFIDLVLSAQLEKPCSWYALEHPTDHAQTARRLRALLDAAQSGLTKYGRSALWRQLAQGGCFLRPCIDGAIATLDSPKDADAEELGAIRAYLEAAMKHRRPDEASATRSPAEYAAWFRAHPPAEKK